MVVNPKAKVASILMVVPLILAGCGQSTQQMGTDVLLACTMFSDASTYQSGVLTVINGGGDVFDYIDSAVRNLKYPDTVDSMESIDIKDKFANALELFANAFQSGTAKQKQDSTANLFAVINSLKERCISLGMDYSTTTAP